MAHANGFGSGSIAEFLHERRDFDQLLAVVANDRGFDPLLGFEQFNLNLIYTMRYG